tara:strand:+ start:2164 stop:3357 length:1194 start_codon:yes stop_codon:yes gene_type:complete
MALPLSYRSYNPGIILQPKTPISTGGGGSAGVEIMGNPIVIPSDIKAADEASSTGVYLAGPDTSLFVANQTITNLGSHHATFNAATDDCTSVYDANNVVYNFSKTDTFSISFWLFYKSTSSTWTWNDLDRPLVTNQVHTSASNNGRTKRQGWGVWFSGESGEEGKLIFSCRASGTSKIEGYSDGSSSGLTAQASSGQKNCVVNDVSGFYVGQSVTVAHGTGAAETHVIASINTGTSTLTTTNNLANTHAIGIEVSYDGVLGENHWHHIVMIYDGSDIKAYVNNVALTLANTADNLSTNDFQTTNDLNIGGGYSHASYDIATLGYEANNMGIINDVCCWGIDISNVNSTSYVDDIYNSGNGAIASSISAIKSQIKFYFPLNDIGDYGPNHLHLQTVKG